MSEDDDWDWFWLREQAQRISRFREHHPSAEDLSHAKIANIIAELDRETQDAREQAERVKGPN